MCKSWVSDICTDGFYPNGRWTHIDDDQSDDDDETLKIFEQLAA